MKYYPEGKDYINDLKIITFEVTYACDKHCSYCYNPIPRYNGTCTATKDAIWKSIMDIESAKHIIMLGGETTFFENSIKYYNEYNDTYLLDDTRHMIFFTHGNNKPEVYEKFHSGKKTSTIGFSYHNEQTDNELYFSNMKLLLDNSVNVVVCILIKSQDSSDWEEKLEVLKKATALGAKTQLEIEISNSTFKQDFDSAALEYFDEYVYKCFKVKTLHFGDVEIKRDEYFKHFPKGLSNSKKMCRNQAFSINPEGILSYECTVGPKLDLNTDLDKFNDYIKSKFVLCSDVCTGITSTINQKTFFESDIEKIKEK